MNRSHCSHHLTGAAHIRIRLHSIFRIASVQGFAYLFHNTSASDWILRGNEDKLILDPLLMFPSTDLYFIEKYHNMLMEEKIKNKDINSKGGNKNYGQNNTEQNRSSESRWKKWAKAYENCQFAIFIKPFEPLGILIAAIALVIALVALSFDYDLRNKTLDVMEEEKDLRNKTLLVMEEEKTLRKVMLIATLVERLEAARKLDQSKKSKDLVARAGQIKILELIVEFDIAERPEAANNEPDQSNKNCKDKIPIVDLKDEFSLKYINASKVNFHNRNAGYGIDLRNADIRNIDFEESNLEEAILINAHLSNAILKGANLKHAELLCTTLTEASLERAILANATFRNANLTRAVLTDADLRKTDLTDADLTGANLKFAKNLSQNQLDSACADQDSPPMIPDDMSWEERSCP